MSYVNKSKSWERWHMTMLPVLKRLRHDCESEASLGYTAWSRPARSTQQDSVSKKIIKLN